MVVNAFSNLLGQSPIRSIQEHIQAAHECAELLPKFVAATLDNKWGKATKLHAQISSLDNTADDLKASRLKP